MRCVGCRAAHPEPGFSNSRLGKKEKLKVVVGVVFIGLVIAIAGTDKSASKRKRGYNKLSNTEVARMRRGL